MNQALKALLSICFFILVSSASHAQNIVLTHKRENSIPTQYTHSANVNFIFLNSWKEESQKLPEILTRLQKSFDTCGIYINLQATYEMQNYANLDFPLEEWETFWYNSYHLSDWEKTIFSKELPKGNNVIFVDSVNWTIEGQGTLGIAYPEFLLNEMLLAEDGAREFYRQKMEGNMVVGLYRAPWTLAHELGHTLMNLEHTHENTQDIMWAGVEAGTPQFKDYLLVSGRRPVFNKSQCEEGYKSPFIKKIER